MWPHPMVGLLIIMKRLSINLQLKGKFVGCLPREAVKNFESISKT